MGLISRRSSRLAVCAAALVMCVGCNSRPRGAQSLKFDRAVASQALVKALDAWKAGQPPSSLKDQSPSIVANDPAWESGAKLLDYRVMEERDVAPNLRALVEVKIDRNGTTSTRNMAFVVGTDPTITVFSDPGGE